MAWLVAVVRQLVEETERAAANVGQYGRPFPSVDDKSFGRWKLGEDELSAILYLMDISNDLVSAARFLLWLLPKALIGPVSAFHGGRNVLMLPRNVGSHACAIGEAFILSSIRSIGSRWSIIAAQLPERIDNDIKNYWNTKLKKKLMGKQRKEQQARSSSLQQEMKREISCSEAFMVSSEVINSVPYWPELPVNMLAMNNVQPENFR